MTSQSLLADLRVHVVHSGSKPETETKFYFRQFVLSARTRFHPPRLRKFLNPESSSVSQFLVHHSDRDPFQFLSLWQKYKPASPTSRPVCRRCRCAFRCDSSQC